MAGFYEHGNEFSGSKKDGNIVDQLRSYAYLKMNVIKCRS
jgi:hypothetical protein